MRVYEFYQDFVWDFKLSKDIQRLESHKHLQGCMGDYTGRSRAYRVFQRLEERLTRFRGLTG